MKRQRFGWFKIALATGFLLGVVLLVESSLTYRYVTRHLIYDHLNWQAGQHLSLLEIRARRLKIETNEQLRDLLREISEERVGQIAWFRIADAQGRVLAETGKPHGRGIARETTQRLVRGLAHSASEIRGTPDGDVLVVALPLQYRLKNQPPVANKGSAEPGQLPSNVAEIAVAMSGPDALFGALRSNLAISTASAVALLVSMAIVFIRLPGYLRGRDLEEQLSLARTVQQRLLPAQWPACDQLEFDAKCLPAYQVGGDYYDVFPAQNGQIAIVLVDVSGKGLPASLLMAHLHGAVHSIAAFDEGPHLAAAAHHLNKLLSAVTARERFASLFWAYYSPKEHLLRYVNAGHLAPMLVRRCPTGGFECHRLDIGGPVLGLLPQAVYEQGEIEVSDEDVVLLYSDGLAEATNTSDVEFGDDRLLATLEANWLQPVREIQQNILNAVMRFIGTHELQDDLTVLVVRVGQQASSIQSVSAELGQLRL